MYSVYQIADYIIGQYNSHNIPISNLKLQKVLYFVQANFLVNKGKPCFSEDFEAWEFGPVVPEIYHKYKPFGSSNIFEYDNTCYPPIVGSDRLLIDAIIKKCAEYTAAQLVSITHRQTPWLRAYRVSGGRIISKQSIAEFFSPSQKG